MPTDKKMGVYCRKKTVPVCFCVCVCVCVCVCIHRYLYIHYCTRMYVLIDGQIQVCMYTFVYTCVCTRMYVYTYACMCACIRIYVCVCVCPHTRGAICMHVCMYVHTYVCTSYMNRSKIFFFLKEDLDQTSPVISVKLMIYQITKYQFQKMTFLVFSVMLMYTYIRMYMCVCTRAHAVPTATT